MSTGSRIALAADDQRLAGAIQTHLKKALGHLPFHCKLAALPDHVGRDTDGLVLLAAATPEDADQILRLVQEIYLQKLPPVVVLLEAEAAGTVGDFDRVEPYVAHRLRWPDDADTLVGLIRDRLPRLRPFLGTRDESLDEIIGRRLLSHTPSLLPLVERIALAAAHDVTVLLTGETGTGKTFLARLMHDCSPRKENPFLSVPCGAQPANLIESAFFGHVKGAFTGADRAKDGKFKAAGNGTILLDEIDTLGLEQQAGLLRVIETGEFEPVGSNETLHCTARIIVASNWDLEEAVERGRFRRDLYYRLNVMSFHLPPLRERVQDIAPLVRGFAARFATKFRKDLFDISPEAMAALETFPWPGNIRQLENAVQQAVLVSNGTELLLEHLPQPVREYMPVPAANGHPPADTLVHNRELLERNVIQRALQNNGYSRARAANALGISRVTLYKKMKKYGLMSAPMRPTSG
ncbi:MAG TPA: sigma 54-interacting transcriptional regulator [Gemmataceae bacterium]|nr:sigma 54-interacting transcriptional regulator [Gemmataceae bacterium]